MTKFKVIIDFVDGSNIVDEITSTDEQSVFKEIKSRMNNDWFSENREATTIYKNPASVLSVSIKDIEKDKQITEARTKKHFEDINNMRF
ncbi:hypothetical protein ABZ756_03090 [Mammaliicoccus sciuri]